MSASDKTANEILDIMERIIPPHTALELLEALSVCKGNKSFVETIKKLKTKSVLRNTSTLDDFDIVIERCKFKRQAEGRLRRKTNE